MNEQTMAAARTKLYSSVISDVLDSFGNMQHAMLPTVRPLDDDSVLFGRARTGLYTALYHADPGDNPYAVEIALIDDLKPGDVVVLACPPSDRICPWGELLSTAARARGAAGCVTDGLVRDIRFIREMRFPVFARGAGPLDSKGRGEMIKMDVPVECGGAAVSPGDWIFGDIDGVVIVPADLCERVLDAALAKVAAENTVREELAAGESLATVFARHGVL
jgi:4-hydroxy-4-methyl-2-oxoglutarate aldolase